MADPSTDSASSSPSIPPMTMEQFASGIKSRVPALKDIPDDILTKRALEAHPDLTKHVTIGDPRRPMNDTRMGGSDTSQDPTRTRLGRTPTADQRIQKFFENHPITREIAIKGISAAGAPESQNVITDFAKGTWKSITDPPQSLDEKSFEAVSGRAALPVYRMAKGLVQQTYGYGQDFFDSIDWDRERRDAKFAKTWAAMPHFKEGSGGAPQAAGAVSGLATMITSVLLGGKKAPEAAEAVTHAGEKVSKAVHEGPTVTAQRMAGTGPALAKKVAQSAVEDHAESVAKYDADAAKISSGNAEADANFKTVIDRLNEDYDAKIADAKSKHAADVGARERAVADLQSQHADKVAAARQKWVQQAYEAKQVAKDQAKIAGRKEALQSAQKSYAGMIIDNVKKTHDIVKGKLGARWDALRDAVGKDTPVETVHKDSGIPDAGTEDITDKVAKRPSSIVESITDSRAMLAGVPEDLKIFNDLMKTIAEKDSDIVKESIPFGDARIQYSAIGEKAFAADGNMRRALFNVYEAYDRALSKTAESKGQGKAYGVLKADHSRFMRDWYDTSATSKGGSPLANLYRAVDKPVAAAHVLGKFGDRLFATFARYKGDGAAPDLMAKMRNLNREERSLPKPPRTMNVPPKASIPAAPAEPKPVAPVEPTISDIEADRAKKLQRKSEDKPEAKPLPAHPGKAPTFDEIVAKTKEAKLDQAEATKEKALTGSRHDAVLTLLSGLGAVGLHSVAYAIPYVVGRVGEMALVSSEFGQRWLSQITPADVKAINDVLAKDPSKTAPVQQAVTNGLIERAKKGQPLPPLSTFQGLLTRAQLGSILRVVAPPQSQQSTSGQSSQQSASPSAAAVQQ